MPRLRSRDLPSKLVPEAERPLADYFPVSRKQLSDFFSAAQGHEKRLEDERLSLPVRDPNLAAK